MLELFCHILNLLIIIIIMKAFIKRPTKNGALVVFPLKAVDTIGVYSK